MKQYVERMIREKEDLAGKIKRAAKTIQQPPYDMDKKQTLLLAEQIEIMGKYLECLNERIRYEAEKERF